MIIEVKGNSQFTDDELSLLVCKSIQKLNLHTDCIKKVIYISDKLINVVTK